MECQGFESRLDRLIGNMLMPEEQRAMREHARACSRCGKLLVIFEKPLPGDHGAARGAHLDEALTGEILARTTGSACDRAAELLPDYADGSLDDQDRDLLADHLDHCPRCATRAQVLADLAVTLPQLAEIEPDPDFVADVLGRTSVRRRPAASRMAAWWQRLCHRPRFALEAAFCGALIMMLISGGTGPVLREAAPQRIAAAWTSPLEDAQQLWQSRGPSAERVATFGQATWNKVAEPLAQRARGIRTWTGTTAQRLRGVLGVVQQHAQRSEAALAEGDWPRAWIAICEMRQMLPQAWRTAPAAPAADREDGALRPEAGGDPDESTEPVAPRLRHQPVNGDSPRRGARDR